MTGDAEARNGEEAGAVGRLIVSAARTLGAAGIADPAREARLLLAHALGLSPDALIRLGRDTIVPASRFRVLVERRRSREPLAFITGRQGFWSLDLAVSAATLIPRADTEAVVSAALDARRGSPPGRVLDLGTGTGAILLALLAEWPDAQGFGIDRSEIASRLARDNAAGTGLAARAGFACGDWDACIVDRAVFDMVVSNPPYIPTGEIDVLMPEVARFEPRLALDGGADGLEAYRRLLPSLDRRLTREGIAVFEIGVGQEQPVTALAEQAGLRLVSGRRDLGGHLRALSFSRGG